MMFSTNWDNNIDTILILVLAIGCDIVIYIRPCKRKVIVTQSLRRTKINRSLNFCNIRIHDSNRLFILRVSRNSYYLCIRNFWTPPTSDHIQLCWSILLHTYCLHTLTREIITICQRSVLRICYKILAFYPSSPQPIGLILCVEIVCMVMRIILVPITIFSSSSVCCSIVPIWCRIRRTDIDFS